MRIIGLTGPARSGKDTVAHIIAESAAGTVRRQGFADLLKQSASRIAHPTHDVAEGVTFCDWLKTEGRVQFTTDDGEAVADISGRQFLQRYGTECHREVFGDDFWLDAVLPEGRDDCDLLLIPDVRFPNEAQRILDRGGEVWRVQRPGTEAANGHASEAAIPAELVGRVVHNAGTLSDLRRTVRDILAKHPTCSECSRHLRRGECPGCGVAP